MCEYILQSLEKLKRYVEAEHFKGYDPYDALNSRIPFSKLGTWISSIAIQIQKRNPLNVRSLLGIEKGLNPKAMGLFLCSYSKLYGLKPSADTKHTMDFLFDWLCEHHSQGYSGYCWGYNFDWVTPNHHYKAFSPSIVGTSYVGKGIFQYYQVTGVQKAVDVLKGICDFILNDLPVTDTPEGLCFSYTPTQRNCCYNASLLGAEILAKTYSITADDMLLDKAKRAVDFIVARQKTDGRWNYSINASFTKERGQIDFHQGFILESLSELMRYSRLKRRKCVHALRKGAEFYINNQFFKDGRSLWRFPRRYPIDIHNQAQGIITFSKLGRLDQGYPRFAGTIARWTIENMQGRDGYFYYRKSRYYTNRISYMRWAQAWMMLALMELAGNGE